MEPEGNAPKGTANRGTERATKLRNKRKRSDIKVKSEPESDSSEPIRKPCKQSKRSTVSETDDSTDSGGSEESEHEESEEGPEPGPQTDPGSLVPTESPIIKYRRRKLEIRMGKSCDEKKFRLKQRSNSLFDHEGVNKEGKKYYRRKPPKAGGKPFKPPPTKPGDGGNIKNHPKGKMLKASKIADQQTAGKSIRPYLNGVGYQLRLAEAVRKLVALSLPDVKKTVRYKAKNGKPSRPVVDPRLMYAHLSLRREKRALDAFDQWNNREVGAHPVQEDQSKIPYICLGDSSDNETENRKHHPKKWMGKELKNNKVDGARSLVSLLTFLMPPSQLGNMKGDAKLFDEDGLLKIPNKEVFSEPETNPQNGESESDDESDDEIDTPEPEGTMETRTGENEAQTGDQTEKERAEPEEDTEEETGEAETKAPESDSDIEIIEEVTKPESNLRNPTPSTSTGSTLDPTLEAIQAQIQQLSKRFYQHVNKTSSNIEVTTPERTKVKKEEPKEEPENADSAPDKEPESDTDECIQNLQDHIASTQTATESPNPQVPEADQTTVPQQDPESQHQERKDAVHDSDTGSQGIEEIVSSDSSQDEVTVDPTNFDITEEATNNINQPEKEKKKKRERNNNREKQTSLPSVRNSNAMSNRKARQLLVHKVPVSFPVAGNLMESAESIGYVYNALQSINAPRDLPADVVVNATLLNSLENNQDRATLIVELDTEDRCNQVLKNAKQKQEQDKEFPYYVTPTPQRLSSRYISNSDKEIHTGNSAEQKRAKKSDKNHKYKHSTKTKDKEPNANNRGTPNAGTPKKHGKEPKSDGPRARPENARPTNAVSTPPTGNFKNKPECFN